MLFGFDFLKKYWKVFAGILIAIFVLILIINSVGVVPVNHTGVWKRFGVVQESAVSEGMHIKIPFADQIESISNQVQTSNIVASQTDHNATTKETAETKDQQLIMSYSFEVQYQLEPSQSFVIYKNYGKDYEKKLIISNSIPIIKQAFALYNSEEITQNKVNIADYIKAELHKYTSEFGINVLRVNFVSYDFTQEYDAILEERASLKAQVINEELKQNKQRVTAQTEYDVAVKAAEKQAATEKINAEKDKEVALINAEKDKETKLINANAEAEAAKIKADNDAYVTVTVANANRDARIAKAKATQAELEAQAAGLNDLIIQKAMVEKWDGKLIPSFGGATSFNYADMTKIFEQYFTTSGKR